MATEIVRNFNEQVRLQVPASTNDDPDLPESPNFYTVPPAKFIILSICTLGFYEVYWFYKNWAKFEQSTGKNIKTFWRAVFAPLFAISYFKHVKGLADAEGVPVFYSPVSFGVLYLGMSYLYKLPDPYWLIAYFSFVPLLFIQSTMVNHNLKCNYARYGSTAFGAKHIAVTIFGGLLFLLVIAGMVLPPVE